LLVLTLRAVLQLLVSCSVTVMVPPPAALVAAMVLDVSNICANQRA